MCMFGNNIKKLLALLLALTMVFSLFVGCASTDEDGEKGGIDYMALYVLLLYGVCLVVEVGIHLFRHLLGCVLQHSAVVR